MPKRVVKAKTAKKAAKKTFKKAAKKAPEKAAKTTAKKTAKRAPPASLAAPQAPALSFSGDSVMAGRQAPDDHGAGPAELHLVIARVD